MKAYIAGKITGDPGYREKFEIGKRDLEQDGLIVLNPAELPEGLSGGDYMRICISMIECADVVYFLPDWYESSGAKLEHDLCLYIGKPVIYFASATTRNDKTNGKDLNHDVLESKKEWQNHGLRAVGDYSRR